MGVFKRLLWKFRGRVLLKALIMVIIFPAIGVIEPFITKFLFDKAIIPKDFHALIVILAIMVVIYPLSNVISYLYTLFDVRLDNDIQKEIFREYLDRFYYIPYKEIISRDVGYYLSRIYDEPTATVTGALDTFVMLFSRIMDVIGRTIAMFILSPIALIFVLPISVISILLTSRFNADIDKLTKEQMEHEALLKDRLTNTLSSYPLVRIFNAQKRIWNIIVQFLDNFLNTTYNLTKKREIYIFALQIASMLAQVSFTVINAYLLFMDKITVGDFVGFMSAFYAFYGSLNSIFNSIPEIVSIRSRLDRIERFLKEKRISEVERGEGVILEDVSFSYDHHPVLSGLTLKIAPGERVLITGPNGSGKSTVLNIIAGLLPPDSGRVITCRRVSLAPQTFVDIPLMEYPKVFAVDEGKFRELLKVFNLPPDKTPSNLSAGQLKKFAVALALSRDADCYILDEPLENVDIEDKGRLMEVILKETNGRILIMTTHDHVINRYLDAFNSIVRLSGEISAKGGAN